MTRDQKSSVVVVTGAGSGIGYATTKALLAKGYHVAAWDLRPGPLEKESHPALSFSQVDVRDGARMRALATEISSSREISGLVACAATFKRVPFLALDEETWKHHFDVNLKGTLLACQAVLSEMLRHRRGSIVLFSSSLARTGSATGGHYSATKGGILGLARSLALEVARDGIRVNVISPGLTDTPQPRGHSSEEAVQERARSIPMGRIGRPEEMADAALFLLSDDSSFITGQDIRISGGSNLF